MNFLIVICLTLFLSTGIFSKNTRVIGGWPAVIHNFPYLVSIRNATDNALVCGGSIISRWNVLTAAHCLYLSRNSLSELRIFSGSRSSTYLYGDNYGIDQVHFHPEFAYFEHHSLLVNDIALIKLDVPVNFNEIQSKIDLPTEPINSGEVVVIAGWGGTEPRAIFHTSPFLQMCTSFVLNHDDCSMQFQIRTVEFQFCTTNPSEIGIWGGDGGGPVTQSGQLHGIISYSFNSDRGLPDVHTAVYHYLDFIRRHMIE